MTFVPGDPRINRNGRPKGKTEKEKLIEALQAEGEKRGEDFFAKVAKNAFDDKGMQAAVLKKIVPDMTKTEHSGQIEVNEMPKITVDSKPLRFNVGTPLNEN